MDVPPSSDRPCVWYNHSNVENVRTNVLGATREKSLNHGNKQKKTQCPWHQRFREVPAMVPLIGPQPNVAQMERVL